MLPHELTNYIIDYIEEQDTKSLLALMLASRITRASAERVLYRTFQISTSLSSVSSYVASYLECLTQRQHLAAYTLRFRLCDYGSTFMGGDELDHLFGSLESILRLTTNLREVSIESLEGHPRLFQLLCGINLPVRSMAYQTRRFQPQVDFEATLCALASNHAFRLTSLSLRSHGCMDEDFTNVSVLPTTRAPNVDLRRLLQTVAYLEGDNYVMHRLLPLCDAILTRFHLYVYEEDEPMGDSEHEGHLRVVGGQEGAPLRSCESCRPLCECDGPERTEIKGLQALVA